MPGPTILKDLIARNNRILRWMIRLNRFAGWFNVQIKMRCAFCGGILPMNKEAVDRHHNACDYYKTALEEYLNGQ